MNFQHCSLVLLLSARDGHPFCAAYDLISARLGKSIGLRHRPLRVLLGGVRSRASIFLFALNSHGSGAWLLPIAPARFCLVSHD